MILIAESKEETGNVGTTQDAPCDSEARMRLAYSLSALTLSSTASHMRARADLTGLRPRCEEADSVSKKSFSSCAMMVSRAIVVMTGVVRGRNWVFAVVGAGVVVVAIDSLDGGRVKDVRQGKD